MRADSDRGGIRAWVDSAGSTARTQLLRDSRPVWITGAVVALLAWQINFSAPTPGLDASWMGGLYLALHDGKDFGSEIVFSYGPLGYLAWPSLWFSWLAVEAFLFSAAIFIAFSSTLVWTLRRNIGLPAAAAVTFLFLATIVDLEQLPLLLAIGCSLAALREDRPGSAVTVLAAGGGALSAFECLIKLSVGPVIFLICLLALLGARACRRDWILFGASSIGGGLALWLLAGQDLHGLWGYVEHGAQVISGYNEAMATDTAPGWEAAALVGVGVALVALSTRARFRDSRARIFGVALTAVASFVSFKYGIVRFEPGHVTLGLSALLGIWLLMPWPRKNVGRYLTATAVVAAMTLHAYPVQPRLDVIANLKSFGDAAEILARPGLRQGRIDQSRANLQAAYGIDPKTLGLLRGRRVDVDPWEITVSWAYELDWEPLPVFQNYSAYTAALDRLNATRIEDPEGPQVILRQNPLGVDPENGSRGFEGRLAAWDPPEQNFATVCNFAPERTVTNWQVLVRIPNRCGPPKLVAKRSAELGQTVPVPQAGAHELVILRLEGAGIEGLERVRAFLWRAQARFAVLNAGSVTYRLVPGTSGDGLIVSRDPSLDSADAFAQLPAVTDMRIEGAGGPFHFDFYRVRIRAAKSGHPTGNPPGG